MKVMNEFQVARFYGPRCSTTKISILICNMLLHYLVKFENPNVLPNFHVECGN